MNSDLRLFLSQMIRQPHKIVALAPSSLALSREMASAVPDGDGPVVELGAGTGKITDALLDAGIPENDLHLFELNSEFIDLLCGKYPDANVQNAPAQSMGDLGISGKARAVVSGLPLLSMPIQIQREILTAAFDAVKPGGVYIQFTYGPKPPVAEVVRTELGLSWTRSQKIWGNLPPARVYVFSQTKLN